MYKPSVCHQEPPPLNRLQLVYRLLWNICLLVAQRIARDVEQQQLALIGDRSAHRAAKRRGRPPGKVAMPSIYMYTASTYAPLPCTNVPMHLPSSIYAHAAPAGMQWDVKFCDVYIYTYIHIRIDFYISVCQNV